MGYTITLECEGQKGYDHELVAWDVEVDPGHGCTVRHMYCGGNNPECDAEGPEIVEGDPMCPVCKRDYFYLAADRAERISERYCD